MSAMMDGDSTVPLYTVGGTYCCYWTGRGSWKEKDVAKI